MNIDPNILLFKCKSKDIIIKALKGLHPLAQGNALCPDNYTVLALKGLHRALAMFSTENNVEKYFGQEL
jgi:hypothetical protein